MALSAKEIEVLKTVDITTKLMIDGYVRNAQKTCSISQDIPTPIIQIILLFYYLVEHFDIHKNIIKVCGEHRDTIIKTNSSGFNNLTFGSVSIPSTIDNIIAWTFKMETNASNQNGLSLGIIRASDAITANVGCNYLSTNICAYLYCSSSSIYYKGKLLKKYGEELGKIGSIIKMVLNMKSGELTYYKNDKSFGVACKVEKGDHIEYKLAVTLYWPSATWKLINFEYLAHE